MAYSLYTRSFGNWAAFSKVIITEVGSGQPAKILNSLGGSVINTFGEAMLDANGNLSVYIDTAKLWLIDVIGVPADRVALHANTNNLQAIEPTVISDLVINGASSIYAGQYLSPAYAGITLVDKSTGLGYINNATDISTGTTLLPQTPDVNILSLKSAAKSGPNGGAELALTSFLSKAHSSRKTLPYGLGADEVGIITIYIPAGNWEFTNPESFLGDEAPTTKIRGLRFIGQGAGISNIIFKPSAAGNLMFNDYWQDIKFEDMSFYSATPGCTLIKQNTTHNAQRVTFSYCTFQGWKYLAYLEGNNNNSEWVWFHCDSDLIEDNGAWLYIPETGSDQFVNHDWYSCKHWSSNAPLITSYKGGHFHVINLDVSNWGFSLPAQNDTTNPTNALIRLYGATHASGVCTLRAQLRVEAKSANAQLLYSEWPIGRVDIDCDWNSQAYVYTYLNIIHIAYINVDGPTYKFTGQYAGGVRVTYNIADWQHRHEIIFDGVTWLQKYSPSDVVTYDGAGPTGGQVTYPPVRFINGCRGEDVDGTSSNGVSVWDCTIGSNLGELVQAMTERTLRISSVYGAVKDSETITFRLPLNAMITGLEVYLPAGESSEGDGGGWTLATTDGSPVTVANVSIATALSAGGVAKTSLSIPFRCSTAAKAKLTLKSLSNVASYSSALILVRGFW